MRKRVDGLYQKSVTLDGKRYTAYAKTQNEVNDKIEKYKHDFGKGIALNSKATFGEFALEWLANYKPTAKPSTKSMYSTIYKAHLEALSGKRIVDLRPHDLQSVVNALAAVGRKEQTLRLIKITAVQILDVAVDNNIIVKNPFRRVTIPKSGRNERLPLTEKQTTALLAHTDHRMAIPALIMYYCGLRRGELLALTWIDINLKGGGITVNKAVNFDGNDGKVGTTKTIAGKRIVPIPQVLKAQLQAARLSSETMLVCPSVQGTVMTASAFKRAWESYQHYLNISCGGRDRSRSNPKVIAVEPFTAHQLRHTYATMLYSAGVDVLTARDLLGHTDIKTTMGIYTHLEEEKKTHSIALLNDYFSARETHR